MARTSKAAPIDEDSQGATYSGHYERLQKTLRENRDSRREKLQMIHAARVSELRKRITSHSSNAMSSAKSKAIRNAQKDRLGELLQRKIDIESRIKHCIQGLEIAFKTTSSEIQTCLQYRIESAAKQ